MTVTVRNISKTPLVVPPSVRRRAGHKNGEDLEFRVSGSVITILPKLPAADDEYTPAQRRTIDAQLAEGLADIKAGRTHGPFGTHREMIDFLHAQVKKAGHTVERQPGEAPRKESAPSIVASVSHRRFGKQGTRR